VANVTFGVGSGEVVVIVGPNGAGKTTTMEMLVGLRRPTSGESRILDVPVEPSGPHRILVGVQLQQAGLPRRIRVSEAIAAASSLYRAPVAAEQLLADVGLTEKRRDFIEKLSGGQRRRLDVALACAGDPPFLVLDEPTSGLDAEGRAELWDMLRQFSGRGKAILASTHDLAEAEAYADRLLMMRRGRLIRDGSVAEILAAAGGEWRLRMRGASTAVFALLTSAGLHRITVGDVTIVIGEQGKLEHFRSELLKSAHGEYTDILSGPVRLEDLFLSDEEQAENDE